ncbi:Mammalian cell entry related domain protein OS=Tsukamurella paurometabola (strain ATCC 8368 / DSM / CCUG 35730 / CIP 100753 / JCM 10117 / KCTC 9821 / NBRC 16120 / NCIMB 702349 / NCTC 13040) OX=521096 GN=Tpau_4175 PE=4 SV=1 [Tsukamurella paurometabola]|uniref:Mammalian cell entry related domain protein n=1 Tax=Tsukamurella paurometabola (strain ATCC 8368 / DSM 20162 / CCUG 35730 / CIP 100753 / JCM 10117 / KCTC 9821 / NBRC 16120 / NCIMB 702349 / NCTC 13040) TaxID=521096 RepID=D5UP35_TSUPD|nr:MlaD family protein [Tsukamurella paurometabola]ADG80744.1 Mammalian cell entry related domain protein [Tsukamurella paurometabola DSM 20162]SUP40798.1 virulence factor Mce family protein [Tsukamurella paurometabola]
MVRSALGSKWLISGIAVAIVIVLGLGGAWYLRGGTERSVTYCAQMPDAIGLYEGNPVTRRGVTVGKVTAVSAEGAKARVEMSVSANERIPASASAVTVAKSLIASRQLALIGDDNGGPTLQPGKCIVDTKTPLSLTKSMEGVYRLTSQVTTGGGPEQTKQAQQALGALARETNGTGPQINGILNQLSSVLDNPGPGMDDLARAFDALAPLTYGMTSNWGDIKSLFSNLPAYLVNVMLPLGSTVDALATTLLPLGKMLFNLVGQYGHMIFPVLDLAVPVTRLAAAGIRNYGDLMGILPPLISAFNVNYDQANARIKINYTPLPDTAFAAANPELTCTNVNRIAPGQCQVVGDGKIRVDVMSVVLRATGAAR